MVVLEMLRGPVDEWLDPLLTSIGTRCLACNNGEAVDSDVRANTRARTNAPADEISAMRQRPLDETNTCMTCTFPFTATQQQADASYTAQ